MHYIIPCFLSPITPTASPQILTPPATPEQAAAPQLPEIVPNESITTSTSSLVDVDSQSVRTVPSDFLEQDIQTETQASRREHESNLEHLAHEKAAKAKRRAQATDNWLTNKIAALSDTQATGIVYANLAAVVGAAAVLGFKGWNLHERGALSWKMVGVGAAVVGAVGVVEGVFSRWVTSYLESFRCLKSRVANLFFFAPQVLHQGSRLQEGLDGFVPITDANGQSLQLWWRRRLQ